MAAKQDAGILSSAGAQSASGALAMEVRQAASIAESPSQELALIEVDLDLDVLEELSSLESVRPGLLASLIEKFEINRMAQLGELELARALGDVERARTLLHSLKGAAATLGLAGLARHVTQLEQAPERILNDAEANEALRVLTAQSLQVLKRWASSHQS